MKHLFFFTLCLLLITVSVSAQKTLGLTTPQSRVDTITASELLALHSDSTIVSYVIAAKKGDRWVEINVQGDKIPDSAKSLVLGLKPGATVLYEQVTAMQNGQLVKLPGKKFVIKAAE